MYIAHTEEMLQEYGAKLDAADAMYNILMPISSLMQSCTIYCLTEDGQHVKNLTRDYAAWLKVEPGDVRAVAFKTLLLNTDAGRARNAVEMALLKATFDEFRILYPEEESKDPYFQNIAIPDIEQDGFSLGHMSYEAGEFCIYDASKTKSQAGEHAIPRLGIWNETFRYPSASKDGSVWMTVTPNETNTMRKHIEAASGNVLTLGLGLGYFAYMAHRKPEVDSVTVVEIDPAAITLFRQHILPQFEHPEKIQIVQADAVEYIRTVEDGLFSMCFADIWKDVMDVGPYLAVRSAARRLEKTKMSYWIEDAILEYMCQHMSLVLMDAVGLPVPATAKDHLYDYLFRLTSRTKIRTPEDMHHIFTAGYLSELIAARTSVKWHG